MKKIQIGAPFSNANQSNLMFIFSLLSLLFFIVASFVVAIYTEDFMTKIGMGAFSIFLIAMSVLVISARKKYKAQVLYIDDKGFTFADGRQGIAWGDIEEVFLTYAIKRYEGEAFEGYPFIFLKLKGGYPKNDSIVTRGKMEVPYIVSEDYFEKYLGKGKPFTIAINIENATEDGSKRIIENLPLKVSPTRPLMEVDTKEEYNKKIIETVSPEKQKEYILE